MIATLCLRWTVCTILVRHLGLDGNALKLDQIHVLRIYAPSVVLLYVNALIYLDTFVLIHVIKL